MSETVSPTDATHLADDAVGATTPAEPDTVLSGRYEILGLLGSGGMGRVYRARDRELGEVVALKVLHRDYVDSREMVERFRQEVRLARKVTHRNVARTYDIGEHEGEKFLTMELVAGEALSTRLKRGPLKLTDVVSMAREILAGMNAAHAAGIIHRDLKPDNVLLETSGRVVVTDFGIARADLPEVARTQGGMVGTPAYMAPEQVSGNLALDARSDVYAFGAVLFEMLTGQRAWPGDGAFAVATARLTQAPPDPRKLRPGLAPRLAAIVLKCLARDRDQRYASSAEVDHQLAALTPSELADAANEPPTATPAPALLAGDARERSVAVMPFRNLGSTADEYFALGLTEDLVDALSMVNGLRVRGRGYTEASDKDVVDTGRRLGVDVVVDGSIRRAGELLRVSARLVGVTDGFQIWSSRFERPAAGAFVLNDEVAQAIAAALSAEAGASPRPEPTNPQAIELYFRARQAIINFWETTGEGEAAQLFRQAVALAPNDPTILSGFVHAQLGRNLHAPIDAKEAVALVRRALVAAPRLPDPWVALAAVRFNSLDDAPGSLRALRRALELGPSNADAHDRAGRLLLEADVWDDALAHLDRALWIDPMQAWARIDRVRAAALSGDWEKAQEVFDTGTGAQWASRGAIHRARIWSWPDAPEVSLDSSEFANPQIRSMLGGYARAREWRSSGHVPTRDDFDAWNVEAASTSPSLRARRFLNQMLAEHAAIGRNLTACLEFTSAAVGAGLVDLAWMKRLRLLDPLRGDPQFQALQRTVEARAAQIAATWRSKTETLEEALASLPA